jgi:hypothetical protein
VQLAATGTEVRTSTYGCDSNSTFRQVDTITSTFSIAFDATQGLSPGCYQPDFRREALMGNETGTVAVLGVAEHAHECAEPPPLPACQDTRNNDLDGPGGLFPGLIDSSDPGCTGPDDPSELGTLECDNGTDDDADAKADWPTDPGCTSATDNSERDPNRPPLAADDSRGTVDYDRKSGPGSILVTPLVNDSDPDGDPLVVTEAHVVSGGGTAAPVAVDRVRYIPARTSVGETVIGYTISDGRGGSDSAHIRVRLRACTSGSVLIEHLAGLGGAADATFRHTVRWCDNGKATVIADSNVDLAVEAPTVSRYVTFATAVHHERNEVEGLSAAASGRWGICLAPNAKIPKVYRPRVRRVLKRALERFGNTAAGKAGKLADKALAKLIRNREYCPKSVAWTPRTQFRDVGGAYDLYWAADLGSKAKAHITINGHRFRAIGSRDYSDTLRCTVVDGCEVPASATTLSSGTPEITTYVPGPGTLTGTAGGSAARGAGFSERAALARASRRIEGAGTVRLRLRLTKKGKRVLRRRRRVPVIVQMRFKPARGATTTRKLRTAITRPRHR